MLKRVKYIMLALGLSSCSTMPDGPSVLVLPGSAKDYARFHDDDLACRNSAHAQIMSSPRAPYSREEGQNRYNIDYMQCMFGQGHRVPVSQELLYDTRDECNPLPPPDLPPPQTTTP